MSETKKITIKILGAEQVNVIAKSLAGGDVDNKSKSAKPEDMDSQKEFIVAFSGVNLAKVFNYILTLFTFGCYTNSYTKFAFFRIQGDVK
jgi:hypothetical protein